MVHNRLEHSRRRANDITYVDFGGMALPGGNPRFVQPQGGGALAGFGFSVCRTVSDYFAGIAPVTMPAEPLPV
jgi:hypothetical protein